MGSASWWTSRWSWPSSPRPRRDHLADTVDYEAVAETVATIVGGPPVDLLEHLASVIADRIMEDPRLVRRFRHRPQATGQARPIGDRDLGHAEAVPLKYWLGLGANLGDRTATLDTARSTSSARAA